MSDDREDSKVDEELKAMIAATGDRIHGQAAAAQASAAHAMLVLMGELDFARLSGDLKERYLNDVFRWSCYAMAGLPVVQRAIKATYAEWEIDSPDSLAAIVRTLAILFKQDPEPLLAKMLGTEVAGVQ